MESSQQLFDNLKKLKKKSKIADCLYKLETYDNN